MGRNNLASMSTRHDETLKLGWCVIMSTWI